MIKIKHYIKVRGDKMPYDATRNCLGVTNASVTIDNTTYTTSSHCGPKDTFSKSFGRNIAIARLTKLLCQYNIWQGIEGLDSMTLNKYAK